MLLLLASLPDDISVATTFGRFPAAAEVVASELPSTVTPLDETRLLPGENE